MLNALRRPSISTLQDTQAQDINAFPKSESKKEKDNSGIQSQYVWWSKVFTQCYCLLQNVYIQQFQFSQVRLQKYLHRCVGYTHIHKEVHYHIINVKKIRNNLMSNNRETVEKIMV